MAASMRDEGGDDEWIKSNFQESTFDTTIGHIEDIIIEPSFSELQRNFMEKYYEVFENGEENKLEYTEIFNEYTQTLEKYLESELTERMPSFSMQDFLIQLGKKQDTLEDEVFELLLSFTDFLTFKEMVLDYKASKDGTCIDLCLSGTVFRDKN